MATRKSSTAPVYSRLPELDARAHMILGCASRGVNLSPGMRLVALTMMLWGEDWERMSMDIPAIADRTSLDIMAVAKIMDKLEQEELVEAMADGWRLTYDRWRLRYKRSQRPTA